VFRVFFLEKSAHKILGTLSVSTFKTNKPLQEQCVLVGGCLFLLKNDTVEKGILQATVDALFATKIPIKKGHPPTKKTAFEE